MNQETEKIKYINDDIKIKIHSTPNASSEKKNKKKKLFYSIVQTKVRYQPQGKMV